jgi:hypothetical protein
MPWTGSPMRHNYLHDAVAGSPVIASARRA